jgi:hypothetical protein
MSTWRSTTLGEIVELQRGHDLTEQSARQARTDGMTRRELRARVSLSDEVGPLLAWSPSYRQRIGRTIPSST